MIQETMKPNERHWKKQERQQDWLKEMRRMEMMVKWPKMRKRDILLHRRYLLCVHNRK